MSFLSGIMMGASLGSTIHDALTGSTINEALTGSSWCRDRQPDRLLRRCMGRGMCLPFMPKAGAVLAIF